jgi:hypothetical protein
VNKERRRKRKKKKPVVVAHKGEQIRSLMKSVLEMGLHFKRFSPAVSGDVPWAACSTELPCFGIYPLQFIPFL